MLKQLKYKLKIMLNKQRSLTIRALNNKLLLTIKQFGAKMKTSKELKARASSHFLHNEGGTTYEDLFTGKIRFIY